MFFLMCQGEADAAVKLEFDEDSALGSNGGTAENSLISPSGLPNPGAGAKAKAPRVKREKKEPGKNRPWCLNTSSSSSSSD